MFVTKHKKKKIIIYIKTHPKKSSSLTSKHTKEENFSWSTFVTKQTNTHTHTHKEVLQYFRMQHKKSQ